MTANRMLRHQSTGRVRWRDGERTTLADLGQPLGQPALAEVAKVVKPDTIRGWHRTLVAQKVAGSKQRKPPGRSTISQALEALVVGMAQEKRSWGSDRSGGALANLGHTISAQTVGNLLKRHGLPPAPERTTTTTWKACIRPHLDVLVATDVCTAEVWTLGGLVTSDVVFFLPLGSRKSQGAGVTPPPHAAWMMQVARHVTLEEWGFLSPGQELSQGRDGTDCPALQPIIDAAGAKRVPLPPRAPPLNASAERGGRSGQEEWLSWRMLCGEAALRHVLTQDVEPLHHERHHQGKGHVLLLPVISHDTARQGPMPCRERLGGLLKDYVREAA